MSRSSQGRTTGHATRGPTDGVYHRRVSDSPTPSVCIAVSVYNASATRAMLEGAERAFAERGGDPTRLAVIETAGAFELASIAGAAARTERYDGVLAIGCIVRGETDHDRYLAHAIANALALIPLETGVCASFGVLTVSTPEQATARAGGPQGNKGYDAMNALLDAIGGRDALRNNKPGSAAPRYTIEGGVTHDKVGVPQKEGAV